MQDTPPVCGHIQEQIPTIPPWEEKSPLREGDALPYVLCKYTLAREYCDLLAWKAPLNLDRVMIIPRDGRECTWAQDIEMEISYENRLSITYTQEVQILGAFFHFLGEPETTTTTYLWLHKSMPAWSFPFTIYMHRKSSIRSQEVLLRREARLIRCRVAFSGP